MQRSHVDGTLAAMTAEEFLARIRTLPWESFEGAYGSSVTNVPRALAALVTANERDDDDWCDAINGVLYAHVWHQGDLYEVTPHVIPFLRSLAGSSNVASREDLEEVLAIYANSAQDYLRGDERRRDLGTRVFAALEAPIESLELPARVPPDTEEDLTELARKVERCALTVRGASHDTQRSAMFLASHAVVRLPKVAARLAEQIDDPKCVAWARLVHGHALARVGRLEEATTRLRAVALEWLGPATLDAANQSITRTQLLEVLANIPALADLHARVAAAPAPAVAIAEGDFF